MIYLVRTLKHRGVEYPAQSHTATGAVQRGNPEKAASAVLLRDPRPAFLDPPAQLRIDLPCLPVDQFGKEAREPVS